MAITEIDLSKQTKDATLTSSKIDTSTAATWQFHNLVETSTLNDENNKLALDVLNRALYDNAVTPLLSLDAINRRLIDPSGKTSLDYLNRLVYASDGTTQQINWATIGTVEIGAILDVTGHNIIHVATPTADTDVANKSYVDTVAQGLSIKASCLAATTGNLLIIAAGSQVGKTLTAQANGVLNVDGVSTWIDVVHDGGNTNPEGSNPASRVLVKDQTAVQATGTFTVVDYTQLSGASVTVNGTTLTEGVNWTATTDNNTTATSLASAVSTVTGVSATASTNVVNIVATTAGAAGNSITLTTSNPTNLPASGATLTGGQNGGVDNGIYAVQDKGSVSTPYILIRAIDFDNSTTVDSGSFTFVAEGTVNISSGWVLATPNPITVDTTVLQFTQFSGAGEIIAGQGLTKTGNELDIHPLDASLLTHVGDISVQRDPAGAVGLSVSGVKVNTDGTYIGISTNNVTLLNPTQHTVAGANQQIQYNNSGVFGADANFTWNGTTLAVNGNEQISQTGGIGLTLTAPDFTGLTGPGATVTSGTSGSAGGTTSGGTVTLTSGNGNGASSHLNGAALTLTTGTLLGDNGFANGGSITLTTGNENGGGGGGTLQGGSITLTTGSPGAGGTATGGNITLTANTPAGGGNLILTGNGSTSHGNIVMGGGYIRPSADSTTALQLTNATGTTILDVDSTNKRIGINNTAPAQALHVGGVGNPAQIRVDNNQANIFIGNQFQSQIAILTLAAANTPSFQLTPLGLNSWFIASPGSSQSLPGDFTIGQSIGASSAAFIIDATNGNIAIAPGFATVAPDASAALDIQGTTKGLLLPRLTTTQKNAIVSPATGLVVFDTTLDTLQLYNGSTWVTVAVPAGATGDIQYNSSGAFAGASGLTTDGTNLTLPTGGNATLTTASSGSSGTLTGGSTTLTTGNITTPTFAGLAALVGGGLTLTTGLNQPNTSTPGSNTGGNLTLTTGDLWGATYTSSISATGGSIVLTTGNPVRPGGYSPNPSTTVTGGSITLTAFTGYEAFGGNLTLTGTASGRGQVTVGGSTPDASASVDIQSTTRGFLPPRMTTTEKNAIVSPATGLVVFDTTIGLLQLYNGSTWLSISPTINFVTREVPSGTVDGSNTVFTLTNTPVVGSEEVYLNGLLQNAGVGNDYTISGTTITFVTAPLSGSVILVTYRY